MRASVIGLGLIGGSAALALKARGWDRDASARRAARGKGIEAADSLEEALAGAEIVFLAVPTGEIPPLLAQVAVIRPEALFSDCASIKAPVARAAAGLPVGVRFVGGHPMAGSGSIGLAGADPDLFRGRPWILVPTARSNQASLAELSGIVSSLGALPDVMDADEHDAAMTRVSHLAHVVAAALALAAAVPGSDSARLAGPGLLDTTRLAEMPSGLLLELAFANPAALAEAVEDVARALEDAAEALRGGDSAAMESFFRRAAAAREALARGARP
jgi:prephenate dehydrogenase